jgi:hypothetical protein
VDVDVDVDVPIHISVSVRVTAARDAERRRQRGRPVCRPVAAFFVPPLVATGSAPAFAFAFTSVVVFVVALGVGGSRGHVPEQDESVGSPPLSRRPAASTPDCGRSAAPGRPTAGVGTRT